jgi:hypothetical protein
MKKKNLILIILITLAIPFIFVITCLSGIWYSQTHTGSRNGQVFDAITGKPIEGAVIKYTWHTSGFMAKAMGGGGKYTTYETLTDKNGKYNIPNIRIKRESLLEFALCPEEVIIYKDGYAVYVVDLASIKSPVRKPIGYPNDNQTYSNKNNIVKLYPWKEDESHYRHIDWINSRTDFSGQGELLKKELEPERKRAHKNLMKDVEDERKQMESQIEKGRRQK